MGQFYDEIPSYIPPWIAEQELFWVATAPLSKSGRVNVSPKGQQGCFHVINERKVWYQDVSGSGIETISHVRENGQITVMFSAFKGPPRICRLFGIGTVHEFGTPKYEALIPFEDRMPGLRSAIVIDICKVSTSCGFSVPYYAFQGHRTKLPEMAIKMEEIDRVIAAAADPTSKPDRATSIGVDTKNRDAKKTIGVHECQRDSREQGGISISARAATLSV